MCLFLHEFNFGHYLVLGQYSATCSWDDTARPHVAGMTLLGHMWLGWHYRISLIWYMRICHIRHILLFSLSATTILWSTRTFFIFKIFCSKKELETAFKDFLASKPSEFYCTDINFSTDGRNAKKFRDHILTW